jgi:hypothetical protein
MSLPSTVNRRYITIAASVLVILWLWVAFDRPYKPEHFWNPYSNSELGDKNVDVFDFPPIESAAIQEVCRTTEWNSSVIFTCDNNHDGIGHVRNSILNCVRFAIAGGGALVLPRIAVREMESHSDQETEAGLGKRNGPGSRSMDYMFDVDHFIQSLRLSCPEMILLRSLEQDASDRRKGLQPEALVLNRPITGLEHPEKWRSLFDQWVEEKFSVEEAQTLETEPIVIDLEQSFLSYPTQSDGDEFAHKFGELLKFRPDTRVLATAVLTELQKWYDMGGKITDSIMAPSFFGAHLRTSEFEEHLDRRHVALAPFMHYDAQAVAYLEQARAANIALMYVSSGNPSDVARLEEQARSWGIDVTHKDGLLKGKHQEQFALLIWDQQAIIDYLVLTKSEEFAGVGHSSFSWNVALKRQHLAKVSGYKDSTRKAQGSGILSDDGDWSDGLSTLYGVRKGYVESSECMWE